MRRRAGVGRRRAAGGRNRGRRTGGRVSTPVAVSLAKIHHYNRCDAACTDSQSRAGAGRPCLLKTVDGAWVISVNGIGQESFYELASRMDMWGWMVFSKRVVDTCPGPNRAFGNAVFYLGARTDAVETEYLTNIPSKDCSRASVERRTALCVKKATLAGPMARCSAHLSPKSEDDLVEMNLRYRQSADYAVFVAGDVEASRRRSAAGGFNLEAHELHPVCDGMADLVLGNTYNAHRGNPTREIDHIFVERRGLRLSHASFCPEEASDHCHTHGDWSP